MNDSISRQAALTALNGCTEIFLNNLPPTIYKADAVEAVKALPPAIPERFTAVMEKIKDRYAMAMNMPCIHNMMAWALYQVWKEYDNEG